MTRAALARLANEHHDQHVPATSTWDDQFPNRRSIICVMAPAQVRMKVMDQAGKSCMAALLSARSVAQFRRRAEARSTMATHGDQATAFLFRHSRLLRVLLASYSCFFNGPSLIACLEVTCTCLLSNHRAPNISLEDFFFCKPPIIDQKSHTADHSIDNQAVLRTMFLFGYVRMRTEDSAPVSKALLPRAYFDDEEMGRIDRDPKIMARLTQRGWTN
jgi:hypothetical protein